MRCSNFSALAGKILILTLSCLGIDSTAAADTPLQILGQLPGIEAVAVSPDGSRLAVINTVGDQRNVIAISLSDFKIIRSKEVAGVKLKGITWTDNNNLLLTLSVYTHTRGTVGGHRTDHYVVASYNVDKDSVVNPLMNLAASGHGDMSVSREAIGDPVIRKTGNQMTVVVPGLSAGQESANATNQILLMPTLYKFKAGINVPTFVIRSTESGAEWLIDENGREFATYFYDEDSRKWTLNVLVKGKWKKVLSESFPVEYPEVVGLSPDGSALWLRYIQHSGDAPAGMSVSLADGTVTREVPEITKYSSLIGSRYNPLVSGGYRSKDGSLEFFNSSMQETWQVILSNFKDAHVEYVSASDDFKKVVVRVEGTRYGYTYMLFDAEKYKFSGLFPVYNGLTKLAEVKQVAYQAGDKYGLSAFVTYPEGERKNLPAIVMPHDGPDAQNDGYFDYLAQALASQGYLIIQPNFRGSDNTIELRNAGFGEWGRKMQTDLSDAVQQLIKDGVADSKRVCIAGTGYGGYAALAGATIDSGSYRCAISLAGIADLAEFRKSIMVDNDRRDSAEVRYFDRYLGVSSQNDQVLQNLSPANLAANADIPVLLIHGTDDSVVPYKQSEIMFNALKKANKQVDLVTLDKEDHHLSNSSTRMQALQAMVDFLRKYNPPN